jgi:anti-sigma regulatory factor (Ser/Thr protein kinase)
MSLDQFPEPTTEPLCVLLFSEPDLPRLRAAVSRVAEGVGLDPRRVPDFVLSAHELAANSVMHADGRGQLRLWIQDGSLVCEVADRGVLEDVSAGRRRPDLSGDGGAGLWIVRQACDAVQIRSVPGHGTAVRMEMKLGDGNGDGRASALEPEDKADEDDG